MLVGLGEAIGRNGMCVTQEGCEFQEADCECVVSDQVNVTHGKAGGEKAHRAGQQTCLSGSAPGFAAAGDGRCGRGLMKFANPVSLSGVCRSRQAPARPALDRDMTWLRPRRRQDATARKVAAGDGNGG